MYSYCSFIRRRGVCGGVVWLLRWCWIFSNTTTNQHDGGELLFFAFCCVRSTKVVCLHNNTSFYSLVVQCCNIDQRPLLLTSS